MRVSILLTRQEVDGLGRLAATERRSPGDQAGYLVAEALRQRGLLGETAHQPERSSDPKSAAHPPEPGTGSEGPSDAAG